MRMLLLFSEEAAHLARLCNITLLNPHVIKKAELELSAILQSSCQVMSDTLKVGLTGFVFFLLLCPPMFLRVCLQRMTLVTRQGLLICSSNIYLLCITTFNPFSQSTHN
jgi:NRPS condensation-like uncharacterized protein